MDIAAIQNLVIKLLAIIAASGAYEADLPPPTIHFLTHSVLEQHVCQRPCPVLGLFDPAHGILLDKKLDPLHDIHARGILLHELTHYVQWATTNHSARNCQEWIRREEEAYRFQQVWMLNQTNYVRVIPFGVRRVVCIEEQFQKSQQKSQQKVAQLAALRTEIKLSSERQK